jgi:hypothetical protein
VFWSKKKVRVRFVDAASGREFASVDVPPEQLPESFEAPTTMHLGDADWQVLSADPLTRAGYVAKGALVLTLRKVEYVSPGDILFSLPTLCDALPALTADPGGPGGRALELHEDDWRQVELVSSAQSDAIRAELASIRRIHSAERTPIGAFRKLHVRAAITEPLASRTLTVEAAKRAFAPAPQAFDRLGFRGAAGQVAGGFAFETATGLRVYGTATDVVTTLALLRTPLAASPGADAAALHGLMQAHELVLVDWCSAREMRSADEVDAYLRDWT